MPPMMEILESRQFMTTTPFLSNECLPPAPAQVPGISKGPTTPPQVLTPPPPVHHHHPHTPPPGSAPGTTTGAGTVGRWTGNQYPLNFTFVGQMALKITRNAAGDLFGELKFDRPNDVDVVITSRLNLSADGHTFTFRAVSANQVIRLAGTVNGNLNGIETAPMAGTFDYWSRKGTYKATFNISRTG